MSDITQALEQAQVADSILDAPVVGSWQDGALAEEGTEESGQDSEWTDPGQEFLDEFEQQPEQQQEQPEAQTQEQRTEATPQQIDEGIQQLEQVVEQLGLNDQNAAVSLAYDLTVPFGADPSSVDAKSLGATMSKAVLSAAQIFESRGGQVNGLPQVPKESAQRFTSDFLHSFGLDPRTMQVDPQRFSTLILAGTLNFMDAARSQGLNAPMDRLNSAEAAEWFVNELHRCFGEQNPSLSREYCLQLADAGGKYILGILGKLQQAQPSQPARETRRGSRSRSREVPANGSRRSSRFQTNQDIFGDDTMDVYQREHGRL